MDGPDDISVGQLVYERIRADIIFAGLPPGTRLRLEPLKAQYSASVTTLREVLSRLASEGFVEMEGQKGFSVSPISIAGLRETANMRKLLECHALADSIAHGDLDWEASVVSAHHKLAAIEKQMIQGEPVDLKLWKRFDREFHTALISGRPSTFLLKIHKDVFDHYLRYQMTALGFRGEAAAEEHRALLKHALGRRVDEAAACLAAHIDKGVDQAVANGPLSEAG